MAKTEKVKLTIGADPEFTITDGMGSKELAMNHLPRGDSHQEMAKIEIGCDGHGETGELRPKPQNCPLKLANYIEGQISTLSKKLRKDCRVNGGHFSNGEFTGGHIHFNVKANDNLVRALDLFLAVPVMMISNPKTFTKRIVDSPFGRGTNGNMYGKLSDVRSPGHGGMEYRTLGSWLCSKTITQAILALSYVITDAVINHGFKLSKRDYNLYIDSEKYVNCNKKYYRPVALRGYSIIKTMPLFKKYSAVIKMLFILIAKGKEWKEDADVFLSWGAKEPKDYLAKMVLSRDKFFKDIFKDFKPKLAPSGMHLYVYGIKAGAEADIFFSHSVLEEMIGKKKNSYKALKTAKKITTAIASRGDTAREHRYAIGFSETIRKKRPDVVKAMVKILLETTK